MATFKTHVALRVTDLDRSLAFYRAMFDAEPVKHKADYAKFDLENPGLNLTLNLSPVVEAKGALSRVFRWIAVRWLRRRSPALKNAVW